MKKKKWLLLIIPAVLILAAALVWFLYLSPRMALSNAADDALSKLEQRMAERGTTKAGGIAPRWS